jgi:hypothetical protein
MQQILDKVFVTPEAKQSLAIIRKYGSLCESFIEFGSRGGVSAIAAFQALIDTPASIVRPRFVAVDLVHDDSIKNLAAIAERAGISFQFWSGHTRVYPIHQTDALIWDTFHAGGSLLIDLQRLSPCINKYIFILGTLSDGTVSEAVRRKLDIATVARELQISEEDASMGLSAAIKSWLEKNPDWVKACEFGEITVLERKVPAKSLIFTTS